MVLVLIPAQCPKESQALLNFYHSLRHKILLLLAISLLTQLHHLVKNDLFAAKIMQIRLQK
jgi:hypothetical protein